MAEIDSSNILEEGARTQQQLLITTNSARYGLRENQAVVVNAWSVVRETVTKLLQTKHALKTVSVGAKLTLLVNVLQSNLRKTRQTNRDGFMTNTILMKKIVKIIGHQTITLGPSEVIGKIQVIGAGDRKRSGIKLINISHLI